MKTSYSPPQQLITFILSISLSLQSCSSLTTPTSPLKQLGNTKESICQPSTQLILSRESVIQGIHSVSFYKQSDQLKAKVKEIHGSLSRVHRLPVYIDKGLLLERCYKQAKININLPSSRQQGYVYISKVGLMGGSNTGEDKDKGKERISLEEEEEVKEDSAPKEIADSQTLLQLALEAEAQLRMEEVAYGLGEKEGEELLRESIVKLDRTSDHEHETAIVLLNKISQLDLIKEMEKQQGKRKLQIEEKEQEEIEVKRKRVLEHSVEDQTNSQLPLGENYFQKAKIWLNRAALQGHTLAIDLSRIMEHIHYFGEKVSRLLGNLKVLPIELLQKILFYVQFPDILIVRQINRHFHEFVTGYNKIGLTGVENRPQRTINNRFWTIKKEVDFSKIIWMPETIPSFPFYQLIRKVSNLPKEFWPHLKNTKIHTINLARNHIGDAGAIALATALQSTQVHTVNLEDNGIGAIGAMDFAVALQGTGVHTVGLKENQLLDGGAAWFAKNLKKTKVHVIDLRDNLIGIAGAIELAYNLQGTSVHTVDLRGNPIIDREVLQFAQVLKRTNIHTVNLAGNYITDETQQLLREKYSSINWMF